MAKKPDTPCAGCGKLLWTGPRSQPSGERMCRDCRSHPPVAGEVPDEAPAPSWTPGSGLGPRGRALWREMGGARLDAGQRVLLEEACRLADRCDRLDAFLQGHADAWLRFQALNDDGSIVKVVVNNALSEARQQQATLKALLAELRVKDEAPGREASGLDDLAKRRDERRRAAGL